MRSVLKIGLIDLSRIVRRKKARGQIEKCDKKNIFQTSTILISGYNVQIFTIDLSCAAQKKYERIRKLLFESYSLQLGPGD